jgi:hypothetical protein
MKMINKTSMTSTKGTMLISASEMRGPLGVGVAKAMGYSLGNFGLRIVN